MDVSRETTYPNITVQLTGKDGNAFAVIGAVSAAIRREAGNGAAQAYSREAMSQESYDALLRHAMATVNVA